MIIGSSSAWIDVDGDDARPRATSERTNSGVTKSGNAGAEILAVAKRRLRAIEHHFATEVPRARRCRSSPW